MTHKELYEKLATLSSQLPSEAAKEEFASLIKQLTKWTSNPSYTTAMRLWIRHSGY